MFDKYDDFYTLFEEHKDEFAASADYETFCQKVGREWLKNYKWAVRVFATAKAGKRTYHPLRFPTFDKFTDLFSAAKFLPMPNAKQNVIPKGFAFLSGNASLAMHVGGKRSWSERTPDTRAHYGAQFYGTYVQPTTEVYNVPMTLVEHAKSYEAIQREDGILILAHDGLCIGSDWLALLPLSENIETLFDTETRELIARERKAEVIAWGKQEASQ